MCGEEWNDILPLACPNCASVGDEIELVPQCFKFSWNEPDTGDGDFRPIHYPPNANVLGWWVTGYGRDYATLVAFVLATSTEEAEDILEKDWPGKKQVRYGEVVSDVSKEVDGRFPLSDWMIPRFKAYEDSY